MSRSCPLSRLPALVRARPLGHADPPRARAGPRPRTATSPSVPPSSCTCRSATPTRSATSRPRPRSARHDQRLRQPAAAAGQAAGLRLQARQLRLRRRDDHLDPADPRLQPPVARRGDRSTPNAGQRRGRLSRPTQAGRADHRLDRRQRRDRLRRRRRVPCVGQATRSIKEHVSDLARRLRAAAGPKTRIVGTTYPDVILGDYVLGNPQLAPLSVVAFQPLINPTLKDAYAAARGSSSTSPPPPARTRRRTRRPISRPTGTVPVAVAQVCQLTYFCEFQDIHARTPGYGLIARLIADAPRAGVAPFRTRPRRRPRAGRRGRCAPCGRARRRSRGP